MARLAVAYLTLLAFISACAKSNDEAVVKEDHPLRSLMRHDDAATTNIHALVVAKRALNALPHVKAMLADKHQDTHNDL